MSHIHMPTSRVNELLSKKKLIGWRTDDFLLETSDLETARGWQPHYTVLPIFEGDENTSLTADRPVEPVAPSGDVWALPGILKGDIALRIANEHRVPVGAVHAVSAAVAKIYAAQHGAKP